MVDSMTNNTLEENNRRRTSKTATTGPLDENKARHAITIGKSPEEIFAFWRNFENLALFMKDVHLIKTLSPVRSHWEVKIKSGAKASWDAEIKNLRENQMISWSSVDGSEVTTTGTVWFEKALAGRGTVVRLSMDYSVPGGKLTELITKFMGEDPDTLIETNLKRLKAYLETGEIPTTEGQPSGRDEDMNPQLRH